MADKTKNVFVSHYHEDEEGIKAMKSLIGDTMTIKNSSVTSDKFNRAQTPEYIKRLLRLRIQWAGTVICLIGSNTHNSEWVDYEIRTAHKKGKPIIGVYLRGAKDSDVPDAINDYADAIVGWSKDSIVGALSGERTFVKADGTQRPYNGGNRSTC